MAVMAAISLHKACQTQRSQCSYVRDIYFSSHVLNDPQYQLFSDKQHLYWLIEYMVANV